MKTYQKYLPIILLFIYMNMELRAQMYVFAQLQGTPINTVGWNLTGAATVGNTAGGTGGNSELILTSTAGQSSGGIFWSQPLNLTQCNRWTAEFEFRIFDGTSADGLAFCFIDAPPTGSIIGGGMGIPNNANGLKVIFDTYNNLQSGVACGGANPEIQIFSGMGYGEFGECMAGLDRRTNQSNDLDFIRSSAYNRAFIDYNSGVVSVTINGTLYLTANAPANFTGYMGFTASTGNLNDRHSIRNVVIKTETAPSDAGPNGGVSYCSGGNVQIGTTPNTDFVYSWSPATGLDQTNIANPTVSLTNTTSVPITRIYTVTTSLASNPGICTTSDNITVTINPTPTATFTISSPQTCINQPVTITYTGNMNGASTFNWNFNGGTIVSGSGIGPYQVRWATSGPKQISLSVNKYGCNSTVETGSVDVLTAPTSTFTAPTTLCEDEVGNIVYTGTATAAATYSWNFDGGTIISGSNEGPYEISWPAAGLKNLSLTVTENGCISPTTQDTARIHTIPVVDLIMPANMCANDTVLVNFSGSSAIGATQYWNWSGGTGLPITQNPSPGFEWTANTAGTYTMAYQITANGCASDTVKKDIQVTSIPTATFTSASDACVGEDVTLTYTGTASPAANYAWQYPSGTLQSGTSYGPLTISYATAGNYNISLTVTENNCVSSTETSPISIHAVPTSTFDLASGICVGQTSPLTYTGTGGASANFDWNFDGVQIVSGSGMGPYVLGDANLGTFNISLQVTENNCVSPITTHQFLVLPSPSVDFSATPVIGCNPLPVQFTNLTVTQPGLVYEWDFGSGAGSSEENPLHIYNDAGSFTVSLKATNGFGCSSTHSKPTYVRVVAHPEAGFSITPEQVMMDNPVVQVVDNSFAAETWTYTMGDGTSYSTPAPSHQYVSEGEYEVVQIVTNSLGCTDKATLTVTVIPFTNVFIPNAFTPSGDGINEVWMPSISYLIDYEVAIYDRWGGLVFESDDLFTGWNGKFYNYGKPQESGVYAYRIRFKELAGKTRDLLGHVTLIR